MRQSLRWALLGTLVLSMLAVVWPRESLPPVKAVERASASVRDISDSRVTAPSTRDVTALPALLPRYAIEPASADLFEAVSRPAPPLLRTGAPMAVVAPPVVAPIAPTAPVAPPGLSAQLLGTMVTPEGRRLVLLVREGEPISAVPGWATPEGWVIQSMDAAEVRWVHPATGASLALPVPVAPNRVGPAS